MYLENDKQVVVGGVDLTGLVSLLLDFLTRLFEKYLPEEIK